MNYDSLDFKRAKEILIKKREKIDEEIRSLEIAERVLEENKTSKLKYSNLDIPKNNYGNMSAWDAIKDVIFRFPKDGISQELLFKALREGGCALSDATIFTQISKLNTAGSIRKDKSSGMLKYFPNEKGKNKSQTIVGNLNSLQKRIDDDFNSIIGIDSNENKKSSQ